MKTFTLSVLVFTLFSCSPKWISLKGSYPETPIILKSSNSYDQNWDKMIDIFAQKGLSIKIIDRSSGLIVSEKSRLTATIEDKTGKMMDKTAYIAIPKYLYSNVYYPVTGKQNSSYSIKKQLEANPVYGEWNVRIKKDGTGSTINVNINNITYDDVISGQRGSLNRTLNEYRSTGVFENQLAEMINKGQ